MDHHRINAVVFDFDYPDDATAFRARQKLLNHFDDRILPILESALDSVETESGTMTIDRLEIDIGAIDIDRMDAESWREAVRLAVDRIGRDGEPPRNPDEIIQDDLEATLESFLRSGSWRWQSAFTRVTDLENAALKLPERRAGLLVSGLYPYLLKTDVRLRLAYQFSWEFIEWLVRQLQPMIGEHIIDSARRWVGHLATPKRKTFVLRMAVELAPDTLREDIDSEIRIEARQLFGPEILDHDPEDGRSEQVVAEPELVLIGSRGDKSSIETEASPPESGLYYSKSAGVVIFHPFLLRFFDSNRLLADSSFRSDRDRAVAVHLLHFLATGTEGPEEHETHLYKLLCGYPLAAPLIRDLTIGPEERAESERLIHAVVDHWKKLRRTSADGLREGFLRREGKLSRDAAGWHLTVEQRHIDVLLDYLPWQVSVIRLPWMPEPLWVDWK